MFTKCVILTVNDEITTELAASALNVHSDHVAVEICPEQDIEHYHEWKADRCLVHAVDIMFDDDPDVVLACLNKGIKAITVSEFIYRYSDKLRYGGDV